MRARVDTATTIATDEELEAAQAIALIDAELLKIESMRRAAVRMGKFPTAAALLATWDRPWAPKLATWAARRCLTVLRFGLDVLEAGRAHDL